MPLGLFSHNVLNLSSKLPMHLCQSLATTHKALDKEIIPFRRRRSPVCAPASPGTAPRVTLDSSAPSRARGAPPSTPCAPSTAPGTPTPLASGMSGKYLNLINNYLLTDCRSSVAFLHNFRTLRIAKFCGLTVWIGWVESGPSIKGI